MNRFAVLQVRDQRVRLLSDPEQGLMVQPVTEEQKALAAQQGQGKALQFMMSFSMQDWADMKQLVPAARCIMPHRGRGSSPVGSKRGADSTQQAKQSKQARRG